MRIATATLAGLGFTLALGGGWLSTRWLDGPWGMLPGGRFHGEGLPCTHERLRALADSTEVEIEARPDRPRSMTTWSVVVDGSLYVPADFLTPWKRWPYHVLEDPRIRLRAAGGILDCRAERVEDAARIEQLRRAIAGKYELKPDSRAASIEVWWFQLGPRATGG